MRDCNTRITQSKNKCAKCRERGKITAEGQMKAVGMFLDNGASYFSESVRNHKNKKGKRVMEWSAPDEHKCRWATCPHCYLMQVCCDERWTKESARHAFDRFFRTEEVIEGKVGCLFLRQAYDGPPTETPGDFMQNILNVPQDRDNRPATPSFAHLYEQTCMVIVEKGMLLHVLYNYVIINLHNHRSRQRQVQCAAEDSSGRFEIVVFKLSCSAGLISLVPQRRHCPRCSKTASQTRR